jgi:ABC-2 type transport system ATP-binding protein
MMDTHPIVLRKVEKKFGARTALAGLDLHVERGTVCALVGPNGAGKTTAIEMLLGLRAPTSGEVRVLGLDPQKDGHRLRQSIGFVPEKHHIYDWMTVPQVLELAAGIYPNWDHNELARIDHILRLPRDRKVKHLSRGELAKLAFEVALSHRPELLILDEPTSGLDPFVRRQILDAIIDLLAGGDRSVLFSTHILSDVERIADRVVVLADGRVAASLSVEAVRARFLLAKYTFEDAPEAPLPGDLRGAVRIDRMPREWAVVFDTEILSGDPREKTAGLGAKSCSVEPLAFEDAVIQLSLGTKGGSSWARS